MFRPCSRYVFTLLEVCSTVHEVCFDRRSRYVSAVLELCFDRARSMFGPCTMYDSIVAQGIFLPCSRYVSTVLEICSDRARGRVRPLLEICFDRTRGMF